MREGDARQIKVEVRVTQTMISAYGSVANTGWYPFWLRRNAAERKTLVMFLYDNGSSVRDFLFTFFKAQR